MYARDHGVIATPIGSIRVEGDDTQLFSVRIGEAALPAPGSAVTVRAALAQLEAWFAGARRDFDVPLALMPTSRGTELRAAMIGIGYGETLSYGELARRTGSSARAIGQLCARNPFPILVPCHRVLAEGARLGNYSGGDGPKTKSWLLEHERRLSGRTLL
ncbi:methylated-DNA--[protein]-cysteine S-methyltransferase [Sphingomonas sp. HITSZ_GF]|uniref:methylated-DNA--[protein]-cysteine S-methyltransferase n=1 Tax=Sphingomonas sp. HITSZ_GF TaxID=3037247 RepID=UPI00240DBF72|nr:methylated-DNA--[protein]-cysteine S-methyltransferase [Sphingomonas sp. HITSZ_GF]MDG2533630.1 methylated-DNA--[protein]-cysteine S-methyltransferase [Sphingomonas sp. HITSZ_GF]